MSISDVQVLNSYGEIGRGRYSVVHSVDAFVTWHGQVHGKIMRLLERRPLFEVENENESVLRLDREEENWKLFCRNKLPVPQIWHRKDTSVYLSDLTEEDRYLVLSSSNESSSRNKISTMRHRPSVIPNQGEVLQTLRSMTLTFATLHRRIRSVNGLFFRFRLPEFAGDIQLGDLKHFIPDSSDEEELCKANLEIARVALRNIQHIIGVQKLASDEFYKLLKTRNPVQ